MRTGCFFLCASMELSILIENLPWNGNIPFHLNACLRTFGNILQVQIMFSVPRLQLQWLDKQFANYNKSGHCPFTLSISLGIAGYDPNNPCSYKELISRADAGMYDVKKERRKM